MTGTIVDEGLLDEATAHSSSLVQITSINEQQQILEVISDDNSDSSA